MDPTAMTAAMTSERHAAADRPTQRRWRRTVEKIAAEAAKHGRRPENIGLVAVSKRHGAEAIAELLDAGHRDFGENYLQEAAAKIDALAALRPQRAQTARWHFIGHAQSRKCAEIARLFDWVHTVDSLKTAARLSRSRPPEHPLNVLLQLNLQGETGKSGIPAAQAGALAAEIISLPGLTLRGLMIIPRPQADVGRQRAVFRQCAETLASLQHLGPGLDQLSMGMSGDMPAAIAEGATWLRLGTAIFGPRPD